MPYYTKNGQQLFVENPTLNPDLISGATQVAAPTENIDYSKITSSSLTPTTPLNVVQPESTPTYPVAGLNAENQVTSLPQEQEQSDLIKRTQSLYDQLTGKATFQAEQETTQGIPALKQTQQDLSGRLKALQNEALAIPLQLEKESEGRGITTGGLAPIQAGRLRANAIQALGVSSLLEASRGNLTLAQDLVDRAVAQKYDPIEAKINANLKNLELLSKDPTFTLAQQNRLKAQQAIQEKKKADAQQQRDNETEIKGYAIEAAKQGAPTDILARIQQAQSPQEALQIASFYLGADFRQQMEDKKFQKNLQQAQYKLSVDKFNEDRRQFNLQYAQQQQKLAIDELAQKAKESPEGANALKQQALTSASELLRKFDAREGTSAVGKSKIFFTSLLPGTQAANFKIQFDNLKSLLSLDNVKYLKGQGQVSDAERRLLEQASAKLNLAQSESEFRTALSEIQTALNGGTPIFGNPFQQALQAVSENQFYNPEQGYLLPQSTPK